LFSISYRDGDAIETVVLTDLPFVAIAGVAAAAIPSNPPPPIATTSNESAGFDPEAYLEAYTVL
jgi:hypothetical protein